MEPTVAKTLIKRALINSLIALRYNILLKDSRKNTGNGWGLEYLI